MKKILIILLLIGFNLNAQQLAFPSAKGAGSYVTGGRGLAVYKVTNLNDNGSGSLRQAVSDANSNGGGTIVFDVSGIINLSSPLGFGNNMTIAGQTAPSGGITIDGNRVFMINVDNLIVRYIRFRGGVDGGDDSVTVRRSITNQIWDHCSFGYGDDEGASWYESSASSTQDNITIQRCLFGENSKGSIIGGANGITTTGDLSFNYNLFYNNSHRFPNTSGENSNIEVINNVVWGVNSRLVRVNGNGQNLNHIGNYYHYNNRGINDDRIHAFSYQTGYPNIYTSGNKIVAPTLSSPLASTIAEMNADNTLSWKHFIDGTSTPLGTRNKGDQLESQYFTNTQHALLGNAVSVLSADNAKTNVLADVGANRLLNGDGSISLEMDVEDTDYINEINLGNYNTPLTSNNYNVTQFTGTSRNGSYDTDNDGMPDVWETATFSTLTRDGTGDQDNDGYTDLEEFLNLVETDTPNIPTITILGNNPTSVVVGENYVDAGATATDAEDGDRTSAIITNNQVNPNVIGTYTVTYDVQDTDGNSAIQAVRTVNVVSSVVDVTGVTLNVETLDLNIGQSNKVTATVAPVDATDKTGVWSSSNSAVATVDQTGNITAISAGISNINFTTNDGAFVDSVIVTVSSLTVGSGSSNKSSKFYIINN